MQVRISRLLFGFFIALALLTLRLLAVMVFPRADSPGVVFPSLRLQSEMQHLDLYRVDDGRGRILFRNGQPWSGRVGPAGPPKSRFSAVPEVSVHEEKASNPRRALKSNPVIGVIGLPDTWPSRNRFVEEQGRSGLEYTFDDLLQRGRPGYFGQFKEHGTQWWQHRLFWLPARPGIDVRTTVDPAWQRAAEAALRNRGVANGAAVILDVNTRDILAMASRTSGSVQLNQAVKAEIPGSVFKVVTAAATWDSYQRSPLDKFYCNGQLKRPGVVLQCWRPHGTETLLQAFAGSCNVAFATMGIERGAPALQVAAERLGLLGTGLQQVQGHSVLPEAERGRVFASRPGGSAQGTSSVDAAPTLAPSSNVNRLRRSPGVRLPATFDNGVLAHTAIGQQDVRISPLQGANLAATIAAGGVYKDARLVIDAEHSGRVKHKYGLPRGTRAISRATTGWLQLAMHMAVHSPRGTAVDLAEDSVDVAVKTGTAQVPAKPGGSFVNSWMVGFAPYQHPQIAFAVYVGHQGEGLGHRQVHAVTRDLLKAYMQFHPANVIG